MKLKTSILSNKYSTFIVLFIIICIPFVSYKVYIWMQTQSTDNAYIKTDISNVSSEVAGVVAEVLVEDNNWVKAGQIIAKIKDDDYKANLTKSESALEIATQDIEIILKNINLLKIEKQKSIDAYEFAKENLEFAKENNKRALELEKGSFASKKTVDNADILLEKAESDLVQSELNKKSIEGRLELLEIQLLNSISRQKNAKQDNTLAQRNLNNTVIRSPIDGMIASSSLQEGNYIRPGVILFSVVNLNEIYIEANFKETQVSEFYPGMKVNITFDAKSDLGIIGRVRNISPATGSTFSLFPPSNATGNFTKVVQRVPVIIDFDIPQDLKDIIIPGMSSFVEIRIDQKQDKK